MEGLDGIAAVARAMESMVVEEKKGDVRRWESEGSQATMVFSIPGLIDQIIGECTLILSTPELLALRLVCMDFNESVLNIQTFPVNLEKPWMKQPNLSTLEIRHMDNESAESLRLRCLSSSELEDIDPRILRHITAEFGFGFENHHRGDYGAEDAVAFHNLVGICGIHGPMIRTVILREFHVAEHHLVILMKAIDNHCPNLQHLEVYISGSCSDPGLHKGGDETLTFGPHLGLTEIIFRIFPMEERTAGLKDAKLCGYTLPVMSALVIGSPNLECLKAGNAEGQLCLDLSRNKKLRSFEYFADAKESQQSFQNQWKAIHDIRETLEELEIFLLNDKLPLVDNEIPEPQGLVFPKLKRLDLHLNGHVDPACCTVLCLILDGLAPRLEYLRFQAGLTCWDTVMSSRGLNLHRGPTCWNVTTLEGVSLLWNYNNAVHHLHSLVRTFPNLVEMQMRVVIVVHAPSEDDLRELLVRLVLAFRTWQQLSTVRFKVERDLFGCSIQELLLQIWGGDTGEDDELVWNRASVAARIVPADDQHEAG